VSSEYTLFVTGKQRVQYWCYGLMHTIRLW